MGIKRSKRLKHSKKESTLIDALFSSTQACLLGFLFGQPERSFFATELIKLVAAGSGGVQRELLRLAECQLVTVTQVGRQKYYQANHKASIFPELHSIMIKTVGLSQPLQQALRPIEGSIRLAFIYGSTAKGNATAKSDIDLMVVSDNLTLEELFSALEPAEARLGKRINPTLYTTTEYQRRLNQKNNFLNNVLKSQIVPLIGDAIERTR